jgi:hypothetical protein
MQDRFGTLKLLHKEMMNMSNEQIRHCRIGKVTPAIYRTTTKPALFPQPAKDDFTFQWPVVYADPGVPAMCRQCIGKACGNAACPARPFAT